MSRVGKNPIGIPDGVEIKVTKTKVFVTGPKGSLEREINPDMKVGMNALDRMVDYMVQNPDVGIAGCKLLNEKKYLVLRLLTISCFRTNMLFYPVVSGLLW